VSGVPLSALSAMLAGGSLGEKLKEGLEKYGAIALITWFALFFLSWILFYAFLQSGVDVVVSPGAKGGRDKCLACGSGWRRAVEAMSAQC
jgi:hypothetical protein